MVRRTLRVPVRVALAWGTLVALVLLAACGSPGGRGPETVAEVRSVLDGRRAALLLEVRLPAPAEEGEEEEDRGQGQESPCAGELASLVGIGMERDRQASGDRGTAAEKKRARFAGSVVRVARLLGQRKLFAGTVTLGLEGARQGRELLDPDDAALLLVAPLSAQGEDAVRALLEAAAALPAGWVRRHADIPGTVVFGGGPGDSLAGMAGVRDGTLRLALASPVLRREVPRLFDGRPPEVPCDLSLPGDPLPAKVTRPAFRLAARPRRASAVLATALATLASDRVSSMVVVRAVAGLEIPHYPMKLVVALRDVLHGLDLAEARSAGGELAGRLTLARRTTPLVRAFHGSPESLEPAALDPVVRGAVEAVAVALPAARVLESVPYDARPDVEAMLLPDYPGKLVRDLLPRFGGTWTTWWAPRDRDGRFLVVAGTVTGLRDTEDVEGLVREEIRSGRIVEDGEIGEVRLLRATVPPEPNRTINVMALGKDRIRLVPIRPLPLPGPDRPRYLLGLGRERAYFAVGGRRVLEAMLERPRAGLAGLDETWARLAAGEPVVLAAYRDGDVLAGALVRAARAAAAAGHPELARFAEGARCRAARLRWAGAGRGLVLVTRTPGGFAVRGTVLDPAGGKGH